MSLQMRAKFIPLFLLGTIFLLGSCKSSKDGTSESGKLKKRSANYLLDKMERYNGTADWFLAKGDIKLIDGSGTTKGSVQIRMKQDSAIWMSVRKLGFEGGRLMVTPDSVYLVNRLDKNYMIKSFDYVRELSGLPDTGDNLEDFRKLYKLILGQAVRISDKKPDVDIKKSNYVLTEEYQGLISDIFLNGETYLTEKVKMFQSRENRELACSFGKFKTEGEGLVIPYEREIKIFTRETGKLEVEMDFSRVAVNKPSTLSFRIPDDYARVD